METSKTSVRSQTQNNHHNHSGQQQPKHYRTAMNKSSSRNSDSSAHLVDPSHSRLPSETPYASPSASLESLPSPERSRAIVVVADKQTQCSPSPLRPSTPRESRNPVVGDGNVRATARKAAPINGDEENGKSAMTAILKRAWARDMMNRAILWTRVLEAAVCASSFSVMAADKTQGWSGDSFDRYREYRFCLSVNAIGFLYSGFQVCASAYHLITGKHLIGDHLRCHMDFSMDQVLSYLLMSASSAAAARVDEWVTNWGMDQFTQMASASIALAFLAFLAFAFSSLLSGYILWTRDFT